VTVEAYASFLETPAGKAHVPGNWAEQKEHPAHPVAEVSLEDAKAFAAFHGLALPTEAQWERAARGTEGRNYPWGKAFDPNKANTKEALNFGPVEVTRYGTDRSPDGCLNMGGNVAEWTRSPFEPYPGSRADLPEGQGVVRGGDFSSAGHRARGAGRRGFRPDAKRATVGFRCVRTIAFSSLEELE